MRSSLATLPILLLLFATMPAWAHSKKDARNRVSFQVEATREVANDWAAARLNVSAENKDPAAVARAVNEGMATALATARAAKGIEVQSGAYVTHPVYDDGRVVRWRASQTLRLETSDVDRLSKLIGELQSNAVTLAGIEFSVQRKTREALEAELTGEALAAFRQRASLIAKGMGEKDWSLIELSVGDSGGAQPVMRMHAESSMRTMSAAPPPAFAEGTSELRIRVSGTIELE